MGDGAVVSMASEEFETGPIGDDRSSSEFA